MKEENNHPPTQLSTTLKMSQIDNKTCSALLDLAITWEAQAKIHDAEGDADCGTGSDVPYAMANMLRDHARAIEVIAYSLR